MPIPPSVGVVCRLQRWPEGRDTSQRASGERKRSAIEASAMGKAMRATMLAMARARPRALEDGIGALLSGCLVGSVSCPRRTPGPSETCPGTRYLDMPAPAASHFAFSLRNQLLLSRRDMSLYLVRRT